MGNNKSLQVEPLYLTNKMTLERLTERIQEEKDKIGKTDGRRFNSRSQTKMKWEIKNIEKSIRIAKKRKTVSMTRGIYTKEELEEYKQDAKDFKKEMESKMESKASETRRDDES